MKKNIYDYFTYLNFDVVLGACGSSFLAQWSSNHFIETWQYWYCLSAAVWCIYMLDRLLDVRTTQLIVTPRHQFVAEYRFYLTVATCMVAVSGAWVAFAGLSTALLVTGLQLGIFVVIYLFLVNYLKEKKAIWFSKELSLTVIYTAATWGTVFVVTGAIDIWALLFFFGLLFADMLMFSYYEYEIDIQHQQRSLARLWGKSSLLRYFFLLMLLNWVLLLFMLGKNMVDLPFYITLLCMFFTVLMMGLFSSYLSQYERYRFWGDWVFSYPFIAYIIVFML